MSALDRFAAWLNVRPHEVRNVTLSFIGAFLTISFLILSRSLREALYLTAFDIETLPYITAAVAILSIPSVAAFSRTLARHNPKRVLRDLIAIQAAGLALLWPFATRSDPAVVIFYLWTALGTLLLTSGFWVLISEYFVVRTAKRVYGLIGAGGTAGAMVMGNSLVWLTDAVDLDWLIPGLIAILGLFFLAQHALPPLAADIPREGVKREVSSMRESFSLAWHSRHLRITALLVFTVAMATTLLDYQFKELAQASFPSPEGLASFFGAFYGWTGAASLIIQLVIVSRFLSLAGLALTLAVLPLVLLLGSIGMLLVPSLILVTAVRGADNSLRKSLYRSAIEVAYVPVPSLLRRKTKAFIDSVVDSVAEGVGAVLILIWVTWSGFNSRWLSGYIIVFSLVMLILSRRLGRQYFATVTEELKVSADADAAQRVQLEGRDLLSGTFTRLDIRSLLEEAGADQAPETGERERAPAVPADEGAQDEPGSLLERLESPDVHTVARALEETSEWEEEHIPALCRLLARDALFDRAVTALCEAGDRAVPCLCRLLSDESTDFVMRRRIPRVLARIGGAEAQDALLDALSANRFEVRYRAAIALVKRRRRDLPGTDRDEEKIVWRAIRREVGRESPVWELQKLLDEPDEDGLIAQRVGVRGELSLEHTFRLFTLVREPEVVKAAFQGVILDDERLKSFALEYLEQALPDDVRKKLWPFIGDITDQQRERSLRSLDDVVSDLMTTGATLFGDAQDRAALKRMLEDQENAE
jgi:ATP/ADP translocase